MVDNDLIEQVSKDFEEFIHNFFFFRKMLLTVDPMVIINMFDREVLIDYCITKEEETYVKNNLYRNYNHFMNNWANYEISDPEIEIEVRRAIEYYALKEAQSSYYEAIDIGINYLKDHKITCISYDDYESLKFDCMPVVSDYDKYDEDKRRINHILLSILNRTLASYDDYISVEELIKENNQNLAKDKILLASEYERQGLDAPFTMAKKINKGPVRTRK